MPVNSVIVGASGYMSARRDDLLTERFPTMQALTWYQSSLYPVSSRLPRISRRHNVGISFEGN